VDRRELLQWLVAAGGLASLDRLGIDDLVPMGRAAHVMHQDTATMTVLGQDAARAVTIAAAGIIPTTATPGATEANVTAFIDTMLAQWYPPADRDRFLTGLAELETRSVALGAPSFSEAPAAVQQSVLVALDAAVHTLRQSSPDAANAHWFGMLKYLTVWGYCTSEVGMRDHLGSWPMPMRYDGNAPVRP
jgi:Gluconate 2-dehydrogenase subunit 3